MKMNARQVFDLLAVKHTKGPWSIVVEPTEKGTYAYVGNITATQILATVECPNEQGRANAQLIAAAPELLEALEKLVHLVAPTHQLDAIEFGKIVALISKARGAS